MNRGDVILAFVPNVGSPGGKRRPALVVQADYNNARLHETIIAPITSNVARAHVAHQLLVDISTSEGVATGLLRNSAVRCERLLSIPQSDMERVIGKMSDAMMKQIDECLKAALGIS
jgi:mRNA interferase MazF